MDCIFCQIVADKNRQFLDQDENSVAFLSHQPVVPGHTLVVPKKHCLSQFSKTSLTELTSSLVLAQKVALKLETAFLGKKVVSQIYGFEINHLHWHLIPTLAEDLTWQKDFGGQNLPTLGPEELVEMTAKIRSDWVADD